MSDQFPVRELVLHGTPMGYRTGGSGPVLLLIHGITSTSETWRKVLARLAKDHTIVAPDLPGHGHSGKPRGDYSLGAMATSIRDLLIVLGHRHATVVGHSLGGGIAMQFSYQFPQMTERLVLVSSGGLGLRVHPMLRAASLPGSELVLPVITAKPLLRAGRAIGRIGAWLGLQTGADMVEVARGYESLGDALARRAFVLTVRGVIDPLGQRVSARDRLYLASHMPSMIVWGEQDPVIPVRHGIRAHEEMVDSRLSLLPDAGHFPHLDDPGRFAGDLGAFIAETEPARLDLDDFQAQVLRNTPGGAAPGS